jgi:hypothetical protein
MEIQDLKSEHKLPAGCACGENAPTLLDVGGECVMVFGLIAVLTRLQQEGLEPGAVGFDESALRALHDTKNRIPKDQQAGCVAEISQIYRDYLTATRERNEAGTQGEQK